MNQTSIENCGSNVKQESMTYTTYDPSTYMNYTSATPMNQQPLPGQPPLPPMPPPSAAVPPPPSVYTPVSSQVHQMHAAWTTPAWQWVTQPPAIPPPTPRELQSAPPYRDAQGHRGNFVKRERYNHNNRNNVYSQRDNYHKKYRRRFEQNQGHQGQYDQTSAYYGAALSNSYGMQDWHRGGYGMGQDQGADGGLQGQQGKETHKEVKEEVVVKKNKQRKPMSMSYPSRPWNKEDAERALKTENDYNKIVKAQSLIIKFPDPDLNKEIVRKFNSGIQNIHFQNPSGPRYCFVQMAENVDIDKAIEDMEKIEFGKGFLKVERKFFRNEDNPVPEEIDPYTLYIGNLPESVNVNEVKSKFPTAIRVDVGFAQKMRNTRYAFIRYNSVDESIQAYKQAHDLMWDTRSIIVRFRRQRGNTCLPGETKSKNKNDQAKSVQKPNVKAKETKVSDAKIPDAEKSSEDTSSNKEIQEISLTPETDNSKKPLKKRYITNSSDADENISSPKCVEVKEEPGDYYDEMDDMPMEEDDEDDDEYQIFKNHSDSDDDDSIDCGVGKENDDDDNDSESSSSFTKNSRESRLKDDLPSDHLDKMFNDIDNIASDIEL